MVAEVLQLVVRSPSRVEPRRQTLSDARETDKPQRVRAAIPPHRRERRQPPDLTLEGDFKAFMRKGERMRASAEADSGDEDGGGSPATGGRALGGSPGARGGSGAGRPRASG